MKKKLLITACVLSLCLSNATANDSTNAATHYESDGGLVIADVVVARPACFAATIIGTAFFVISLPVALTSRSVHRSADALVTRPARATFTRPLGDFNALKE